MIFVYNTVENIVGKWKKCWFLVFSPFPTMFSKPFFFFCVCVFLGGEGRAIKTQNCVLNGKKKSLQIKLAQEIKTEERYIYATHIISVK